MCESNAQSRGAVTMESEPDNFLAAGRILMANKASAIGTITAETESVSAKFIQYASVEKNLIYPAGVLGHYFYFGVPLISTGEPMRCNFKEAGDKVALYLKQT